MITRRGFIGALAALAAMAKVPLELQAEAEPILSALMKAQTGSGDYLFLVRPNDFKELWRSLDATQRFGEDMGNGFISLFVRGKPVVHLDHADKILGKKDFALISRKAFDREVEASCK